jgi:hypothetical protein
MYLENRYFKEDTMIRCTDRECRKLLKDVISGLALMPGKENDLKKFNEHLGTCTACRSAILEHAYVVITVPTLEEIAETRGQPLVAVIENFARGAEQLITKGRDSFLPPKVREIFARAREAFKNPTNEDDKQ